MACLGLLLLRTRGGASVNAWSTGARTPNGGTAYGRLETYFAKITEFDAGEFDSYFVTANAVGQDHLLQMSAGTDKAGHPFYEFDMPVTGWSREFAHPIKDEARRRGRIPVETDGGAMVFLDISFPDKPSHEDFARWVAEAIYKLPENTQYEITWG